MQGITVTWPKRDTKSITVHIFGVRVIMSYETPVMAWYGDKLIRRKNIWGPTTGRHLNENQPSWLKPEIIDDAVEFNRRLNLMILEGATKELTHLL